MHMCPFHLFLELLSDSVQEVQVSGWKQKKC